ncbi:hypothetical protein ACH5RR_029238 [Cinchona calisaya]|uniref:Uncharacterized protein n=1 Tax=Cinchona calisaya TaxID=153742 RepID=A0ABD2YVJ1_9GENT
MFGSSDSSEEVIDRVLEWVRAKVSGGMKYCFVLSRLLSTRELELSERMESTQVAYKTLAQMAFDCFTNLQQRPARETKQISSVFLMPKPL